MNSDLDVLDRVAAVAPRPSRARLMPDPIRFKADFDRLPVSLQHNLHELDLFSKDSLQNLSRRYLGHPHDYFVAGSAPLPGVDFYSVPHSMTDPVETLATLDQRPARLLFKRPESHDPRFRSLLDTLFGQVVALQPHLASERIVRLESAVFITSAATTTPFHFDPEINFFAQVEGEKTYHVYGPQVLSERELENFYVRNVVNIGQVDLAARDPAAEVVFRLRPGLGLHQPQNSPHWVETGAGRSVSYAFVFETERSRAIGRARSFNHMLRRFGLNPLPPGMAPARDALKSESLKLLRPTRHALGGAVRRISNR